MSPPRIKLQKAMDLLDSQKISNREFREMFPEHFETNSHPSSKARNRCRCGGSRCLFEEFFTSSYRGTIEGGV